MTSKCKFRISLSADQIKWIMSNPECPADLRKQLSLHMFKINEGLVAPAFTVKSFSDLPPEQRYAKICSKLETGQELTAEEQQSLDEYRYTNGLMSEAECIAYEKSIGF